MDEKTELAKTRIEQLQDETSKKDTEIEYLKRIIKQTVEKIKVLSGTYSAPAVTADK